MLDTGYPFNAFSGILIKSCENIFGGEVGDRSALRFISYCPICDRFKWRRIIRFLVVIRPIAIFYFAVEGVSHPTSISIFIYANVGCRNHTVIDSCNVGISNASANRVIDSCNTSNDSANSGLNGVDNNFTIKPTIRNS